VGGSLLRRRRGRKRWLRGRLGCMMRTPASSSSSGNACRNIDDAGAHRLGIVSDGGAEPACTLQDSYRHRGAQDHSNAAERCAATKTRAAGALPFARWEIRLAARHAQCRTSPYTVTENSPSRENVAARRYIAGRALSAQTLRGPSSPGPRGERSITPDQYPSIPQWTISSPSGVRSARMIAGWWTPAALLAS